MNLKNFIALIELFNIIIQIYDAIIVIFNVLKY